MLRFKKIHLILNEFSTNGKNARKIIEKKLNEYKEVSYTFYITSKPKDGIKIIDQISSEINQADLIVAVGGDGTLSEIVNGLMNNHLDNPLALIPTGAGNDFARDNQIPTNIEQAVDYIFSVKNPKNLDLIKISSEGLTKYAVNSCGIGIDGRVINTVESTKKVKNFGSFSYLWRAFFDLFKQNKFDFTLKIDDEQTEVKDSLIVLMANTSYFGGGIRIHPETNNEDRVFDILYAENVKFYDILIIVFKLLFTKSHLSHSKLKTFRAKKAEIILHNEEYTQIDGEPYGYRKHQKTFEITSRKFWV